ncbi:hypothetical protein A2422_03825 [Candidatus Woesebacteria bacterium RIFOXYC1_FULL_31_51]|uniref:Uncharacterized protein n=1 Tax=Candidatus Woesebacteria bacterium GW2011_GWC2_31_9 TaxID=1618586 RepID=A0A0F9Z045_9BACT|nr:MAG: hypothetical protein UR17_C0001G0337 [Candidatus Woesebacteria bacterium GW2011_GWF1_31_35]KKP32051.1 MAG: hypothetical protein UR21_C0003G0084 [Candidatus Woesebacteria bacterium GW2011_GWC2_31_9]OGM78370.1 MAG: hypothetical protein A2375_03935 [Candidatus Woesebacteria bacterium RIFOXYB1_FULL_31_120]OGM82469.1 MAG: hypothetical protein A2422_03825 [Candidatus Woesebacteria bacterium RIFOXYC1_FULL_31_51]HLD90656.1 hypothetical protein [Patescibacteria group bacterium]
MKQISRYIAPMILFAGGVWLLSLRIPGWSMILGLPAIQIGIIFVIFNFDNSSKEILDLSRYHIVKCDICNDPTAAPMGEIHEVCPSCRTRKIKS